MDKKQSLITRLQTDVATRTHTLITTVIDELVNNDIYSQLTDVDVAKAISKGISTATNLDDMMTYAHIQRK